MNESDVVKRVREVLDHAIAEVVEAEYDRLTDGMTREDRTASVDRGLRSLTRLQQGTPPDYSSEWVALFYLCWYQPRQIHLAYAALRGLLEQNRLPKHVVDYGCGALAVQFALAIVLAEDEEAFNAGLAVHGVDPNLPMVDIGKKLWGRLLDVLWSRIDEDPFFLSLGLALESMADVCSCHASVSEAFDHLKTARASASDDCWITAMHATYASNMEELKNVFDSGKCQERGSAIEVVTFFESGSHHVFFKTLGFDAARLGIQPWAGTFDAITRWRKGLSEALPDLEKRGLLRARAVEWDPDSRIVGGEDRIMFRSRTQ